MQTEISRVPRPRTAARASYDRLSRWYDWVSAPFERAARERGLELLDVQPGEVALELGFGTGWGLLGLANAVGQTGRVFGIDQSQGMLRETRKRIGQRGLDQSVAPMLGDCVALPIQRETFDALFMSFTLELFDTPDIRRVLLECQRVMRTTGRLCVVSLSKSPAPRAPERLYEFLHAAFPTTIDCRPIHVSASLVNAGFKVVTEQSGKLWGLPVAIALAILD